MAIDELWSFWKKYENHITALTIIFFLLFVAYYMFTDLQLKQEIKENCGWGEEDYHCYCEKSEAMRIKNKIDELLLGQLEANFGNITVV